MDFFEKLSNTLSSTGKDIAKKTKDISDTSKLNSQINKEQDNINKLYSQIGKTYFEKYAEQDNSDLKPLCDNIKAAQKNIANYQDQIKSIKGITSCPKCGKDIPYGAAFCNFCGNQIATQAPVSEPVKEETNSSENKAE